MDLRAFLIAFYGHASQLAHSGGQPCACTSDHQCEYHGRIAPELGALTHGLILGIMDPCPN